MLIFFAITSLLVTLVKSEDSKVNIFPNNENMRYEVAKTNMLISLSDFKCIDSISSCSSHGKCNEKKDDCICDQGWLNEESLGLEKCNYSQKRQLTAFLYELFLGFGAGHFYTERYNMALAKLGAFIFGIYIICLFPLSAKFLNEKCESDYLVLGVSCFYYFCAIGLAFWFVWDLVMFGMNKYPDGKNHPLLEWGLKSD
jgi:hypothetical protein